MAGNVHVKRRLTDLSKQYPWNFKSIGEEFFPRKPTEHLTDQFASWSKANLLRIEEATPLGDDDQPADLELVQDADISYQLKVYGLASPGKWITQRNADPSLQWDQQRVIQLTTALRLRLEYLRVVQRLRATAFLTQNQTLTAGQRFDNYTSGSSKPISTIQLICDNLMYANQGRKVNKIALTTHVLRAICKSEEFKDLVKFTTIQNAQDLAKSESGQCALIEQTVGVASGTMMLSDAVYNAAASNQTPIYTTFMGPDMVFGYVEELGLNSYSLSAGFQWAVFSNDPQAVISVPRYSGTMVPTEDLRVFSVIDPKIIEPTLGFLLKGCIDATDTTSYGSLVAY